jgi:hypothetical protein
MSDFVSVRDVVLGTRPCKVIEGKFGPLSAKLEPRDKVKPIDIVKVACVIEDETCSAYCFDEFGRFRIADKEAHGTVLGLLADCYSALSLQDPYGLGECDEMQFEYNFVPEWHSYGWMIDDLPDFEGCYGKWKLKHNPSGKEVTIQKNRPDEPRKSNTVWGMVEGLIRMVITDHLSSKSQSTDEFVAELMSKTNSTNTMKLLSELQKRAPDSFTMDEKTFRNQLKNIFGK